MIFYTCIRICKSVQFSEMKNFVKLLCLVNWRTERKLEFTRWFNKLIEPGVRLKQASLRQRWTVACRSGCIMRFSPALGSWLCILNIQQAVTHPGTKTHNYSLPSSSFNTTIRPRVQPEGGFKNQNRKPDLPKHNSCSFYQNRLTFQFRSILNRTFKSLFRFRLNRTQKLDYTRFRPELIFWKINFIKKVFI
jgi:hypothetical protein